MTTFLPFFFINNIDVLSQKTKKKKRTENCCTKDVIYKLPHFTKEMKLYGEFN